MMQRQACGVWLLLALVPIVCSGGWCCEAAATSWKQDRFAISFWVDPTVAAADVLATYRQIKAANFTVVMSVFGDIRTPQDVAARVSACEELDLGLIIHAPNASEAALPQSPAVWGYQLWDEPGYQNFAFLEAFVANVTKLRDDKMTFINLFPNYNKWFIPPGNYTNYVETYLDTVDPPVLCMDNYPHMGTYNNGTVADTRDAYIANVAIMRQFALERNIPWWNFFNSMPYGSHLDPTDGGIRWQVFTSLAFGARGVLWFCYWYPTYDTEFPQGGSIITPRGTLDNLVEGPHYDQAKELNSNIVAWGPVLMNLTSTGAGRVNATASPAAVTVAPSCLLHTVASAVATSSIRTLVGCFQHSDGREAVLLVNDDWQYSSWVTVAFTNQTAAATVAEIDPISGQPVAVVDASPSKAGLQLRLREGSGRLFIQTVAAQM